MPRSAEVNASLVESIRHRSVLLFRLLASFLAAELERGPVLSAIAPLDWDELSRRFTPDEGAGV